MIHRRTCELSHHIKGPITVNEAKIGLENRLQENSQFTVGGPLIWYESAQVRLWIILNIHNNDFYHLGKSQICARADHYFRSSKPHSGKLWVILTKGWLTFKLTAWSLFLPWLCPSWTGDFSSPQLLTSAAASYSEMLPCWGSTRRTCPSSR